MASPREEEEHRAHRNWLAERDRMSEAAERESLPMLRRIEILTMANLEFDWRLSERRSGSR